MEFLNPGALYAAFVLPLLLVAYLIRGRPRRVVFSSLLFLTNLSPRASKRPWGALLLPPLFFLQLLLLALLILAMGEPVYSTRPLRLAIVLDTSASMQAIEGRATRFDLAREELRNLLGKQSPLARVDLYRTVPRIERVGESGLSLSETLAQARALAPLDLGDTEVDYEAELGRLKEAGNYDQLFLITDHPVRGRGGAIRAITVGRPQDNLALSSFYLSRASPAEERLTAAVEVSNFSAREERVELSVKAANRTIETRTIGAGPRSRAEAVFDGLPVYPYYEAEIETRDGLTLDNRRLALAPGLKGLGVLGVSPKPDALWSLRSLPGLSLRVVPPNTYGGIADGTHALEIFHFSAPSTLPQSHALLILPPEQNPIVRLGRPVSRPLISGWREPHALTRYINFALFRPAYARAITPMSASAEAIIETPEGPLALLLERQGYRYLVLGFDPLPFLGKENLPMSIFTLNLLDWFQEASGGSGSATGEPMALRGGQGGILVTPSGDQHRFGKGRQIFSATYHQGLYQVIRGGEREYRAVNFSNLKESDLLSPAVITLPDRAGSAEGESRRSALWPYLLLACLALFFFEWFANPPASRSAAPGSGDYARSG